MNLSLDPLGQLRLAQRSLALEAFSLSSVKSAFKSFIPSMKDGLSGLVGMLPANDALAGVAPQPGGLSADAARRLAGLQKLSYMEIRTQRGYAPEGLSVSYLKYLDVLAPVVERTSKVQTDVLRPLIGLLAQSLSDRNSAQSSRVDDAHFSVWERRRDAEEKSVGQCFKHGRETERPIGELVARSQDWAEVYKQLSRCEQAAGAVKMESLKADLKTVGDYFELLQKDMDNQDHPGLSKEAGANIAGHTYQAGKEVEAFALNFFRVQQLSSAIAQTSDFLTAGR